MQKNLILIMQPNWFWVPQKKKKTQNGNLPDLSANFIQIKLQFDLQLRVWDVTLGF